MSLADRAERDGLRIVTNAWIKLFNIIEDGYTFISSYQKPQGVPMRQLQIYALEAAAFLVAAFLILTFVI